VPRGVDRDGAHLKGFVNPNAALPLARQGECFIDDAFERISGVTSSGAGRLEGFRGV